MDTDDFVIQLERTIGRYDLLHHPFYEAWVYGVLTRADLQQYAQDYFHQIEAFPRAVSEFARRIPNGALRVDALQNVSDALGGRNKPSHAELWLAFAEGIGVQSSCLQHRPSGTMKNLTLMFQRVVTQRTPEEALAAFYAYQSQVPRAARAKLRALREKYGATQSMCAYFEICTSEEFPHPRMWRDHLVRLLSSKLTGIESALASAEAASEALWKALSGIENACLENLAVASGRTRLAEGAD